MNGKIKALPKTTQEIRDWQLEPTKKYNEDEKYSVGEYQKEVNKRNHQKWRSEEDYLKLEQSRDYYKKVLKNGCIVIKRLEAENLQLKKDLEEAVRVANDRGKGW